MHCKLSLGGDEDRREVCEEENAKKQEECVSLWKIKPNPKIVKQFLEKKPFFLEKPFSKFVVKANQERNKK